MRTFRPALLSAALAVLALAAPAGAVTTRTPTPGAEISAYYDSGRWSDDIAAVVKRASTRLRRDLAARKPPRRPLIVLDIDETSLFNAPCLEPVNWDLSGLATCAAQGGGVATPAVRLYNLARRKHVTVAFITGRPDAIASVTRQNLRDQGFHRGYKLVLKPASYTQDSVVPYKSDARATFERQGYTILENLGDQRSDLAGGHARHRYKLPNPVYVIT
ncbi:MAG: HAD family acid phosphatase [Solirubrobacteraceae bacterium]